MLFDFKKVLQFKNTLVIYVCISLVVVIAGVISYQSNKKSYERFSREQLKIIAEGKAEQLADWYKERLAQANFLYTATTFAYTVNLYNENNSSKEYAERIIQWLENYKKYYNFECVTLFSVDGRALFCSDGKCAKEISHSLLAKQSIAKDKVVICDIDFENKSKEHFIDLAVPLKAAKGTKHIFVGTVLLKINPASQLYPMIDSWPVKSASGELVLIKKDGEKAQFLSKHRFSKFVPDAGIYSKGDKNTPLGIYSALNEISGFIEGRDYRGEPVMGYSLKVKDTSWWLFAKIDKLEYLAPLRIEFGNTVAIVVLILVSLLLVFYLLYFKERIAIAEQKTDLEQKRNKLREDEQYFAKYASDAILLTDLAGNIMEVNEGAVEMTGYSRAELLSMNGKMLRAPELRDSFQDRLERISEAGKFLIESIYLHKNGKKFPVESNVKVVTLNGKKYLQGVIRDISERKKIEEQARLDQTRYKELFEAMSECVAVYRTRDNGENFYFADINKSAEKLEKVKRDDILGKNVKDVFPGVEEFGLINVFREVWNTGKMISQPVSLYKDNRIFGWRENYVYKLPTGEVVAVYSDVTERKQAEEQIKEMNINLEKRVVERTVQLSALNKELETFAYSVSHDLRTPLRGIDGWCQAVYEDYGGKLDNKGLEYLEYIRKEAQRMGNLIDDLLKLSRISRGDITFLPVDLSKLVHEVAAQAKKANPKRELEFVIEPGLIVNGDPGLLEIMIGNLIENSVKFTGPRLKAVIEVGKDRSKEGNVFFVKDNGVGFDMVFAGKLFGAFQRMHRQSEFPGTGIGLATVQRVINRHGGQIWAESEIDKGTTIYFRMK